MIICIDPGHGGRDPGAQSGNVKEKDITLKIGLALKLLLEKAGFTVVMTRESDVSLGGDLNADLYQRKLISDRAKADVFFSIHVNAGGGTGAEIYVNQDGGDIRPLAQGLVDSTASIMGYHGKPVKASSEAPDGGLYVVDRTIAKAMLIEIGFIDSSDLQKILDNIDKFAPLFAQEFCKFYNVKESEPVEVSDWAQDAWNKAIQKGIIKGDGNGVHPQNTVTCEQLVVILDRLGLL